MTSSRERRVMRVLLALWTLFILYGSFIPFTFNAHASLSPESLAQVWWRFVEGGHRAFSVPDVLSNVLLFVPFGFLAAGARIRPGRPAATTVAGAVALTAAFATLIEIGQLFAPGRVSSLIDVAANTTGTLLGAVAAWAVLHAVEGRLGAWVHRLVREAPEILALSLLLIVEAAQSFYPFEITLDVGTLWANLKAAQRVPLASLATRFWGDLLVERLLPFALASLLALRALQRRWPFGARRSAWLGVSLVAVAFEVGKLGFVGRQPSIDNALLGVIGALVGVTLLSALIGSRAFRARPAVWLLALALLFLVHTELTPYEWRLAPDAVAERIHGIEWMPLVAYFYAEPGRALFDLWEKLVRAGFVGFAALAAGAAAPPLVVGLVAGTLLEAVQIVTASRVPSVTDVLIIAIGAHAGGAVWRWYRRLRATPVPVGRGDVVTPATRTVHSLLRLGE